MYKVGGCERRGGGGLKSRRSRACDEALARQESGNGVLGSTKSLWNFPWLYHVLLYCTKPVYT